LIYSSLLELSGLATCPHFDIFQSTGVKWPGHMPTFWFATFYWS